MTEQPIQITEQDVQSLVEKLNAFNETLTPGEAASLAVHCAAPGADDIQGYAFVNPTGRAGAGVTPLSANSFVRINQQSGIYIDGRSKYYYVDKKGHKQ